MMKGLDIAVKVATLILAFIAIFGRVASEWLRRPRLRVVFPGDEEEYSGEYLQDKNKETGEVKYHLKIVNEKKWFQKCVQTDPARGRL